MEGRDHQRRVETKEMLNKLLVDPSDYCEYCFTKNHRIELCVKLQNINQKYFYVSSINLLKHGFQFKKKFLSQNCEFLWYVFN